MSNTKTEAQRLADELVHEATKRVCNVAMMPYSLPIDAAKELRRLDAVEQRYIEMMANPCPEWDGKAYMQAIANLRAQLDQALASKSELLGALELLLKYTKSCEGLLNCKPAGQIQIAESAIAKATGEHHDN